MIGRTYYEQIWQDFDQSKHLILVSGARQAGKTTLAKAIAANQRASLYFNYDLPASRAQLQARPTFFEEVDREAGVLPLVVLDEIHKYEQWKTYL